jgi:hypothetical protein
LRDSALDDARISALSKFEFEEIGFQDVTVLKKLTIGAGLVLVIA